MFRPLVRRLLTVVVAMLTLGVVAGPSPALAASMFFSKSSGTVASVSFLEVGEEAGVEGNYHFWDLQAEDLGRGRAQVFGNVFDVQCEAGVDPYLPGWEGAEPDPSGGCDVVGFRYVEGSTVSLSIDRKLSSARLTGTVNVYIEDSPTPVATTVDLTWTAVGDTSTSRESGRYTDSYGTYSYRYTFTGRNAAVSGSIGSTTVGDEDGEVVYGQLGKYRSADRSRS
jgi:hypothetical protein